MRKQDYEKLPIIDVPYEEYAKTRLYLHTKKVMGDRYIQTHTVESGNILGLDRLDLIHGVLDTFETSLTPIGRSSNNLTVYFAVNYSGWLQQYYKLRFWLNNINSKILYTLFIWELVDHIPGMIMSWSDLKLYKGVKQWLRK